MPLPFLISSSDGSVAGGAYTRFSAPTLSGTWTPSTSGAASQVGRSIPGALGLVQHGTVVSTLGARAQVVSTAAAAVTRASYVYITQTTGPVSTSSFASGESAPPLTGMGAALVFDAARLRIGVYSTVVGSWIYIGSSNGATSS
jgi:hypothetical protein